MRLRSLPLLFAAVLGAPTLPALAAEPTPALPPTTPEVTLEARLDALVATDGLTAEVAAARAAAHDPTARRRVATTRERLAQLSQTELQYVPQVTATAQYSRLSEVDMPELAPGISLPQVLDNYSLKLELAIPLSDYLFRFPALADAAELRVRAARVDEQSAAEAAAQSGRRLYWQWVRSQLRVLVDQQSVTQLAATVVQVQARVDAQRASRADLLRIQAQLAEARRGVIVAEQRAAFDAQRLRQAIGAGPDEPLTIGEDIFAAPATPARAALATLLDEAARSRSELRALDTMIAALDRSSDATEAGWLPRLDAFASANYDNPNQRFLLGGDAFNGTWMVGARLSWKLNDALAVDPQRDQIGAQVEQLRADRDGLVRQLEVALADAQRALAVAAASRVANVEAKAAAEESYRMRKDLLAADRATAVELIDAETELSRVRLQEIDVLIDLRLALSELDYTLGKTPTAPLPSPN